MVEESTAASKNLAQETQELSRLVGQFTVEGGRPAQAATPARRATPALRTSGRGGAARKVEPTPEASWEEF